MSYDQSGGTKGNEFSVPDNQANHMLGFIIDLDIQGKLIRIPKPLFRVAPFFDFEFEGCAVNLMEILGKGKLQPLNYP